MVTARSGKNITQVRKDHLPLFGDYKMKLGNTECIRIYDSNGDHRLSILNCDDGHVDLATPDGEVLWCLEKTTVDLKAFDDFPRTEINEKISKIT